MRLRCSVLFRFPNFYHLQISLQNIQLILLFFLLASILLYFLSLFPFLPKHRKIIFKALFSKVLSTMSFHYQVSLQLGAPFVHVQVLSQALRRQDLISSQQSFTFSPLKFVKASWTHWIYSSLTSGLFSFHFRIFCMWLLAVFNLVHSLKSPTKSLWWRADFSPYITLMFSICFKLACLVRIVDLCFSATWAGSDKFINVLLEEGACNCKVCRDRHIQSPCTFSYHNNIHHVYPRNQLILYLCNRLDLHIQLIHHLVE